ncbi:MAG: DUF421 domain-containing protein [Verrucomicrobiota bacterium]|nr:DUF421 domain-containing protein [Verrucomicrobiota bacterium]
MTAFAHALAQLLGLGVEPKDLTFLQMSLRGLIILVAALIILRLDQKRSLARKTAFDTVLIVVVASVLARAINGSAAFLPTLGGCLVMVGFHRFLGFLACRWPWLGALMKSEPEVIVRDGERLRPAMRRNHISDHDLDEDMRLEAATDDLDTIAIARVERSGDISFIKKRDG